MAVRSPSGILSVAVRYFLDLFSSARCAEALYVSAGARQIATGLNIAKQTGAKVFVTSMCIGSGMGMAAIFVNEQ
jgi:hypothetical protein